MLIGLNESFAHDQNGMTRNDMEATRRVATQLDEVIIFRSTGPWSKRWLEKDYPSKNFHVKGKSSDWGPHAGLVPYDGTYSKVGHDPVKAQKGTAANDEGIQSGFAKKVPLVLSWDEIQMQLTRGEDRPERMAIGRYMSIPNSQDLLLFAQRSGDGQWVVFRAFAQQADRKRFEIRVYPPTKSHLADNSFMILNRDPQGKLAQEFCVMASNEMGTDKPMTGDYDLFAVCPRWSQYGSQAATDIIKPGIQLQDGSVHQGATFYAGQGMDNVLDPSLHTMSKGGDFALRRTAALNKGLTMASSEVYFGPRSQSEHPDMGNLTPRILRCINQLNMAMGAVGERAALRRVHHNAESHRNRAFGALNARDMTPQPGDRYGDGFPLTVFQPLSLSTGQGARYGDVCTLESMGELQAYAEALRTAGFYLPKNWVWGLRAPYAAG